MKSIISSLAYIKAVIDSGMTIWDSLTNLMIRIINENTVDTVSTEVFCTLFEDIYGIKIPLHPMNTIIGKIKKYGIIEDSEGKMIIRKEKITIKDNSEKIIEEYDKLLNKMQEYINNKFKVDKTRNDIENIFVGFLNNYDSDILLSIEIDSFLPEIQISNKEEYMINKYIKEIIMEDDKMLHLLENILMANIHLSAIFIVQNEKKLKLNRVYVYLDTRILLRLTGIEGNFRKDEYLKLLDILKENKCNLRIFEIHYKEVTTIFNDCVRWLENRQNYNPKYASKALRYFIENNCKVSDVLISKAKLDELQMKYKITIDTYNYNQTELDQFNIDERRLNKIITNIYRENVNHFENHNVEEMIWNDVKAISSIYRRRKGVRANQLENIQAILITNNRSLSKAVREYNKEKRINQKYPECVTDTYWGTSIWLNTAYKESSFFKKKLIADSIAFTEINPKLKEKYLANIKEKRDKEQITDKEYYVLREYDRAYEYISDATCNSDEEYTDELPEEILETFKDDIRKPLEDLIKQKSNDIEKQKAKITAQVNREEIQISRIEKIAKNTSKISMVIIGVVLNVPSVLLIINEYIINKNIKLVINIVCAILGILLGLDGFQRKIIGKKIYEKRKDQLLIYWNLK